MSERNTVLGNGVETWVKSRYAKAAEKKESALCCPTNYETKYLSVIPEEILAKDYGCGNPSAFLKEGDTVLDLGSGGGKLCYIASQIVGPRGRVIGVDFNQTMLDLARKYQKQVGHRIGWHNVEFKWGKIQNLRLDLEKVETYFKKNPIMNVDHYEDFQRTLDQWSQKNPLIPDESIDVIISNCVLNLVRTEDKKELFKEMYRVLKKGGRVAISDVVSDEAVPQKLQEDSELWSGCISGAFQEKKFLQAFEETGFYGIQIENWSDTPWQIIQGIEFRSVTVTAYKGLEGPCLERNQAVIYKGPWKQVEDDDHHILRRGTRTAVCDKTFHIFSKAPYQKDLLFISPRKNIPLSKAEVFDCQRSAERDPRETKGLKYRKTVQGESDCNGGSCC